MDDQPIALVTGAGRGIGLEVGRNWLRAAAWSDLVPALKHRVPRSWGHTGRNGGDSVAKAWVNL